MGNIYEGQSANYGRSAIYDDDSIYLLNNDYDRAIKSNGRNSAQRKSNVAERNAIRAKRRRRRRIRRFITFFFVIVLSVILIAGLLMAGYYFRLRSLEGTWCYKEDLTDEVAINAALWLSDIDNYNVDSDWVREHCNNMFVDVDFTITYDGINSGSYSETVDEATYNECVELANEALASCIEDIIVSKLELAGYSASMMEADIDTIVGDTFGMPLTEYLKQMDVPLLPSYEDLSDKHSDKGSFMAGISSISFMGSSSETEEYVISKNTLIFKNSMQMYERKVSE